MSVARTPVTRVLAGALAALAIAACSEKLATPGDCPDLCPNAELTVFDTTIVAVTGGDSSFTGYVAPGTNTAIFVTTDGFAPMNARGIYEFLRRPDSVLVNDTLRAYTIDSVAFLIGVVGRDTAVKNLRVALYRLPEGIDTAGTFAELAAALTPETFIDTVPVPDSVRSGTARVVLSGEALARVALAPADSGVLRIGMGLTADGPTGARLGGLSAGPLASFYQTFVTSIVADTAVRNTITRGATTTAYEQEAPDPAADASRLVVGGAPSTRSLIRFELPAVIRDSATIVRARLELEPSEPVPGLPNDPAEITANAIIIDVGAKSPLLSGLVEVDTVLAGQTGRIEIEVRRIVGQWQAGNDRPPAIFLIMEPEAATFTLPLIVSTADPARAPRLRIAYVRRYPFVNP
ncbi:MAG TPA: hypothetical protein VFY20_08195 [Gemmatimonadales bacterium]|nr:hypothetical protein [Gemmatimonadales bacterium]